MTEAMTKFGELGGEPNPATLEGDTPLPPADGVEVSNPDFERDLKAEEAKAEPNPHPAEAELERVRSIVDAMRAQTAGKPNGDTILLSAVALGEFIAEQTAADPIIGISVLAEANRMASTVVLAKMLDERQRAEVDAKGKAAMEEASAREARQRAEATGEGGVAVILPTVATASFKDADPYPSEGELAAVASAPAPQDLREGEAA